MKFVIPEKIYRNKVARCRFLALKPLGLEYVWCDGTLDHGDISYKSPCESDIIQYNETKRIHEDTVPKLRVFHHYNEHLKYGGIHIPHCADPSIFYPGSGVRDIDFLLCGALSNKVYPLRQRFRAAFKRLNGVIYKHPGHEVKDAWKCDHLRDFAAILRRTKIVCFCASTFEYRLQKFVEAAACGATIASDLPSVEPDDDLHDIIIKCDASWTVHQLVSTLKGAKCDPDRSVAYAAKYTPETYCERIMRSLDEKRIPTTS